ncbi:MAG TPA: hypothetical protein VFU02_06445 [Polyangiaceae bacterium]|nr:hypothetical protein [Polyangiaceae bacterium]
MKKIHDRESMSSNPVLPADPLELDEDWDEASKLVASEELVPEDELEIEELAAKPDSKHSKGQVLFALRQVRDYLIELDLESRPSGECLEVCKNVLGSLNGATETLGSDVAAACAELARALGDSDAGAHELSLVKKKYDAVASLVPELGEFDSERRDRVKLILRSILEQVPGLGPLGRSKLEAAGYGDVHKLSLANHEDLVAAGLAPELASRVFERVLRFNRRLNSVPPEADRSAERERLKRLTSTLMEQNQRYEALENDWSKGALVLRNELREERAETMSQVSLLLARLGELGTAERIERLPFDKKASELERLLGALDDTHGSPP